MPSRTLQVSGESILKGLRFALEGAQDAATARPVLEGFALAIRLAGVVGLDELCEHFVEGPYPKPFTPVLTFCQDIRTSV